MANQRTFQAQALVVNGVSLGGTSRITFSPRFGNILRARMDGSVGVEEVNRVGLGVAVSIDTEDVLKANAILAATPGDTTFSVRESGSSNYHHYKITAASGANAIVITGLRINAAKNDYARMTLSGRVRFASAADTLADVLKVNAVNATPPTHVDPMRLYRPNTASFDDYGGASAINPLHVESIEASMDAVVLSDSADADIGETAVDIAGWNPLQLSLTHRDAKHASAPGETVSAQLLELAHGVLTTNLIESRTGAAYTLTVQNLLWTGADQEEGAEYSTFRMSGEAAWKRASDGTVLTMNGADATKLFRILVA